MNLFVTGGCGFIGSNFVRQRLTASVAQVERLVNLDALTYAGNPANLADLAGDPRYVFAHGDIADTALVARLLAEHRMDAVAHFAAESHVDRSIDSAEPFVQTNVVGTLRLLEGARRHWEQLPAPRRDAFRFLHVSTDEVYGPLAYDAPPLAEDAPFAPSSPYAATKAAGDHLARAFHRTHGLPVLAARVSNNYGPRQLAEKLIPLVILHAVTGRPLPLYGDGLATRDWLHVCDCGTALWRLLQDGRTGEAYNIGGGNERTNLEVVRRICAVLDRAVPRGDGRPHATQITHVADRPGHDRRYALDCGKIRRETGWTPQADFASGLEETVAWYLGHRAWLNDITVAKQPA